MGIGSMDGVNNEVSKKEALNIAQQFISNKEYAKELELSEAYVRKRITWYRLPDGSSVATRPQTAKYDELTTWVVVFPSKWEKRALLRTYFVVEVNVTTGKIESYGSSKVAG